jgi:KipI family sensor histidine kinase inhibitor
MPRLREAGDSALLVELDGGIDAATNARVIAIAAAIRAAATPGVRDVVPTYRSIAVYFDPLRLDIGHVRELAARAAGTPVQAAGGRTVEVPVRYGGDAGPDLADVAAFAGLRPEDVIARHASRDYRVYMLGFLPGFAYLGSVPPEIAMPRRATPRLRVPAGSVGIAGAQTAVYPRASPGGWQIIGRTPLRVFDPQRVPPAIFAPGDSVRFVPLPAPGRGSPAEDGAYDRLNVEPGFGPMSTAASGSGRTLTVLAPGLLTTIQDCGRWGYQASGVPVSGALDLVSHRLANALVGNAGDAATLEVTIAGPELRFDADATVAITGADLGATHDGATAPVARPVDVRRGGILRFGARRGGARAYLAIDGGITVPPILGSRATHVLTATGGVEGRPLVAGDRLPLGAGTRARVRSRVDLPAVIGQGGARVRVLPGPHDDFFPADALHVLQRSRFTIAPQSDRMGYRLAGAAVPRLADREMISDATFAGGIQVPASGAPILLMADRQTTGGYPQIATIIAADLPLAAQLAPGDWIEFQVCSRADALAALVAQEGKLLAVG